MGIVEGSCKYRARGVSIRGNEPRRRVPGAPSSDTPRERQANFRGSCGYRARGISIRGKFVLSRNLGYKTRGWGRYVAKSSSDPRRVYPDVKLQGRDLVRVVGIVVHFAPLGFGTHGKFIKPQWENGPRRRVPGAPSSGTPRESQANFRVGTVWGL